MSQVIAYLPFILEGMVLTVAVALLSLVIAILLGVVTASAKLSNSFIARSVAGVYTTIIRGIPDLVLLTLIFFGGQIRVNNLGKALGWG